MKSDALAKIGWRAMEKVGNLVPWDKSYELPKDQMRVAAVAIERAVLRRERNAVKKAKEERKSKVLREHQERIVKYRNNI